ncbi:MAG: hypothetical protein HQK60_18640 [Deltaproteobacteria bacterium]|nr:hypothetical protein [Deltaproteobacteria bacterium]
MRQGTTKKKFYRLCSMVLLHIVFIGVYANQASSMELINDQPLLNESTKISGNNAPAISVTANNSSLTDGVWKTNTGRSIYVQTYDNGGTILVSSIDGKTIIACYDDLITNNTFDGTDIYTGKMYRFVMQFNSTESASFTSYAYDQSKGATTESCTRFAYAQPVRLTDGIWKDRNSGQNFYVQTYTDSSMIILRTPDAKNISAFYAALITGNTFDGLDLYTPHINRLTMQFMSEDSMKASLFDLNQKQLDSSTGEHSSKVSPSSTPTTSTMTTSTSATTTTGRPTTTTNTTTTTGTTTTTSPNPGGCNNTITWQITQMSGGNFSGDGYYTLCLDNMKWKGQLNVIWKGSSYPGTVTFPFDNGTWIIDSLSSPTSGLFRGDGSGVATNDGAPQGYQTSPFALSVVGVFNLKGATNGNGRGAGTASGTWTINCTNPAWNEEGFQTMSGFWTAVQQ